MTKTLAVSYGREIVETDGGYTASLPQNIHPEAKRIALVIYDLLCAHTRHIEWDITRAERKPMTYKVAFRAGIRTDPATTETGIDLGYIGADWIDETKGIDEQCRRAAAGCISTALRRLWDKLDNDSMSLLRKDE